MRVLRRITGAKQEDDQWRVRYNRGWFQIFDDPEVFELIKLRKLQQAGYVQCITLEYLKGYSKGEPKDEDW